MCCFPTGPLKDVSVVFKVPLNCHSHHRAKMLKARLGSILQKPNWNFSGCKMGQTK